MNPSAGLRILVVDDDPFMLKLLHHMLTGLGHTNVQTFERGQAALDSVEAGASATDLILCDLSMPEMDGVEFVRELVERKYAGSMIVMSGKDERILEAAEKLVRAHAISVLGHLAKPVTLSGLTALLKNWRSPSDRSARAVNHRGIEEIQAAIAKGELVNHYQPKVHVASGRVTGVEALVRWNHPTDGLVFPVEFIAQAEEHHLIDAITEIVVKGAFEQFCRWEAMGLPLEIAINVSMDTLASLSFPDLLARAAADAGVPSHRIVIEVTESRLMLDLRGPLEVLTRLRLKGFRLSIDDFGTGHSSLVQLRDLPFEELKIDRGFVHRAPTQSTLRAIYMSSLGLAKQLGIEVVAEGVEDRDDWEFLRKTGCDFAQGYYIGRPMAGDKIAGWIKDWQTRVHV